LKKLITAGTAHELDSVLAGSWGLNPFALVEAAGRLCADTLIKHFPELFIGQPRIVVLAGSGNNAADAMVMLRALIMTGKVTVNQSAVLINRLPHNSENDPRSVSFCALKKLAVPCFVWDVSVHTILSHADIIIDGIMGTGITGAMHGIAGEMIAMTNEIKKFTISIDLPSGACDGWRTDMPIIIAHATLAIEPVKAMIYQPYTRAAAGTIIPVSMVFPDALIDSVPGAELLDWESTRLRIPQIIANIHKYDRGVVEIHAGSPGSAGAARLAARGAQAAGAGLVRSIVDDILYPVLSSPADGIMVVPASHIEENDSKFQPNALLLGPGWGEASDRLPIVRKALEREHAGIPLILDADALRFTTSCTFNGNAILTPHPGEAAAFTGVNREEILANPERFACTLARAKQAVVLLKGHVLVIASPDGRVGYLDGMMPVLAAGGSGDVLAGLCAALAARLHRNHIFDGYIAATAAASLLISAGACIGKRFVDPLELADRAATLAGEVWL
jgi:NAD(P)H-hydrate epimerase